MRRITTIVLLALITLCGTGYVLAQTGGPAWRPRTNTPAPNTPGTTTLPYIPSVPATPVPYNPTYTPNYNPNYNPTAQRNQVQSQLNSVQQQEANLRAQLAQLRSQERSLKDQLAAIDQSQNGYYNNGYNNGTYAQQQRHDHGKHKGWEKNGKGENDNDGD